ncbi:MAG: hypothetical protein ACRD1Y_12010 [Terriglobales bacterium]
MADYTFLLTTRLSQDQQLVLQVLQEVCRAHTLNLYFSGSSMRDLLTAQTLRLLQFTCEGDPVPLQKELAARGAEQVSARAETSTVSFHLRRCRARIEAAQDAHGHTGVSIHEDLRRRSLTLNSVGLSLNPGSRGLPLDPANGVADIEARLIRMNHAYVFVDDPMAALRAVRLRTRLGFAVEERTQARMDTARDENYLADASPAAKGQEWEAIAYEPDPAAVVTALEKERWLGAAFGAGVRSSRMNLAGLARLSEAVEAWEQLGLTMDVGQAAMPMLLGGLSPADQNRIALWLPSRHLAAGWKKLPQQAAALEAQLLALPSGSRWLRSAYDVVQKYASEVVLYATVSPRQAKGGRKLREYYSQAAEQRRKLPLGVLRGLRLAPHSQRAEEILRPWFERLLAGQDLSETELSAGVRGAALAQTAPTAVRRTAATAAKEAVAKEAKEAAAKFRIATAKRASPPAPRPAARPAPTRSTPASKAKPTRKRK